MKTEAQKIIFEHDKKQANWRVALNEIDQLFTAAILRKIVNLIYKDMLDYAEKELDKCYIEYFELAKKNVPYAERADKIDIKRVGFLERQIVRINKEKTIFKVRPLRDWLQIGDDQTMRKMGSQKFISRWLDLAIIK